MIQINDKADCCGCTACASICPKDAILMEPDVLGFKYPRIDMDRCIDCGLCEKVCAFNVNYDKSLNLEEPEIYAVRHKDIHEIETSRSGAAFVAISDYVLENGGIVYGVGYNDDFRVIHKRATTKSERNEFKGSKYVQSDLLGIFKQVKDDLKKGKTVLFSGTPCQTAGLNLFIGRKLRDNLILVDIICHGVSSPNIWYDYLKYIEKKYKYKVVKVNFRDKSRVGWSGHVESFIFDNGKKIELSIFKDLFLKSLMNRSSCSRCFFTNYTRPSDFTLGDYWGWEKISPRFNIDNKGCSLLFVNTNKGLRIFEKIKVKIDYILTRKDLCTQPNLLYPTTFDRRMPDFIKMYSQKGFISTLKRYGNQGWRYKIKQIINKIRKK